MIQIMQRLALLASGYDWGVQPDGTFVEIKTTQLRMTEDEVIGVIEEVTGEGPIVEELLLNSLLQPAGRDPLSRKRLFKFAHQSFFDWFIARAIVQWSLKIEPPSQVISDFVTDMRTAIGSVAQIGSTPRLPFPLTDLSHSFRDGYRCCRSAGATDPWSRDTGY